MITKIYQCPTTHTQHQRERVQKGREIPRAVAEELLDRRCSLRPMKGLIVPLLPWARKVPPPVVGGPSICQERWAAERNPLPVVTDRTSGQEEVQGGGEGWGVKKKLLFRVSYKYLRGTCTNLGDKGHTHKHWLQDSRALWGRRLWASEWKGAALGVFILTWGSDIGGGRGVGEV